MQCVPVQIPPCLTLAWIHMICCRSQGCSHVPHAMQDSLALKLQEDSAAFKRRLEDLDQQLQDKQSQLEGAATAYSTLQNQSVAANKELSARLQSADQRIATLQTDAQAAAQRHHEVRDRQHASILQNIAQPAGYILVSSSH